MLKEKGIRRMLIQYCCTLMIPFSDPGSHMTDKKGVASVGGDWTEASHETRTWVLELLWKRRVKSGRGWFVFHNRMEEQESSGTDRQPTEEVS